jgi:hypothetical protein
MGLFGRQSGVGLAGTGLLVGLAEAGQKEVKVYAWLA